jgi:putative phosphoesterase
MDAVRMLLLADTHLPRRARDLPPQVWAEVDRADVVVHAGDWVGVDLLDALEERATRLVGVHGNNDGPALRARLPEVARVELAGVRLAVVHETGAAAGRERRCAAAYPDVDVLVFGHSHIPWDTTATRPDGRTLRLLNPGSPTDRRRQPTFTWMTAVAADGRLEEVRLHHLPPRRN